MKTFYLFIILLLISTLGHADTIAVRPPDFEQAMRLISGRMNLNKVVPPQVDVNDQSVIFTSRQPLRNKQPVPEGEQKIEEDDFFIVRTQFFTKSSTVEKRTISSQGREDGARLRFTLKEGPERFEQFFYDGLGLPMQVYNRSSEMIVYAQFTKEDTIETKEWIYARRPNGPKGSTYHWKVRSDEFYRRVVFAAGEKGEVNIERQVVVQGIDAHDYARQRRTIDSIHKVGGPGGFYIKGEDVVGKIPPVFYITREGKRKSASFELADRNELVVRINEPPGSYPLLIESE